MTYPEPAGDLGIFVMNADGTNPVHLARGEFPRWFPDGTRIVFDGLDGLQIMDLDGTNIVPLFPGVDLSGARAPTWSPNGQLIAFSRVTGCQIDPYGDPACHLGIWILRTGGSQLEELSLPVPWPGRPDWRP